MKQNLYFKSIFTFLITLLCHVGFGQVTLPFDFDGGKSNLPSGVTQGGLGSDYSSSPKLKFDDINDNLVIETVGSINQIKFSIKHNPGSGTRFTGKFKLYGSVNGINYTTLLFELIQNTDYRTVTENIISITNSDLKYFKWVYEEKVNGNIALGKISILGNSVPQTAPILTTPQTVTGTYGVLINQAITGQNITSSTTWYNFNLPLGLNIVDNKFQGIPEVIGQYTTTLNGKNGSLESNVATINFNIAKANQTFELSTIEDKFIDDENVNLPLKTKHSSNNNLEANDITYTSSDPTVVAIVNGNQLDFLSVGNATITATSSNEDSNYNPISPVTFTVTVKIPPINTATIPHTENYNNNLGVWSNYKISGAAGFFGWYKSSGNDGATIDGSFSSTTAAKSYLISPKFENVKLAPLKISFNYSANKSNKKIKILYSNNYNGYSNPENQDFTWDLLGEIESYTINQNLSKLLEICNSSRNFHIALLYEESSPTTKWNITNMKIEYSMPKPNSTPADIINDSLFQANWDIPNSTCSIEEYELDVYRKVPQENIILDENFDWVNGTGGNDGSWYGSIASTAITNNNNQSNFEFVNGYLANKSVKLGTGSAKGSLKTPQLNDLNGDVTLTFRAGAWNGSSEQTQLILKIEGEGTLSQTSVDMVKGGFKTYTINIFNGTPTTRISFEGKNASNSRFFIDDIKVFKSSTKEYIEGSAFPVNQENSKEITGVNLEENTYYYVVRSVKDGLKSTDSEEIKVYNRTTWDGTLWDNDVPNEEIHAVIKGDLQLGTDTNLETIEAKTLKIFPDQTLTVKSGSSIQLRDKFENISDQPIVFEEGAYLIQQNDLAENSGHATFKRNASFFGYDSKFWSSPVSGQKILKSSSTDQTGFIYNPVAVYNYNEAGRNWVRTLDPNFNPANGYIIQVGTNYPFMNQGQETTFESSFTGVPNNGVYTFQAFKSANGLGDNGIGNPYGSPLSIPRFLAANPSVNALYFWNEDAHYVVGSSPASYHTQTWWSCNGVGCNENNKNHIGPGVGFIARVNENSEIVFNNSMRELISFADSQNRVHTEKDRFWLSLNSNGNKENQILIGYIEGATNGIDEKYDTRNLSNANSFILSHSNNNAMIIEGRQYPLDINDQIPLYFRASKLGEYTIKLENKEGVFNSQPIYLIDNELNLSINLNEITEYTFDSELGNFLTRFEIRYQPKEALSITDIDETSDLIVYKNENLNKVTSKEKVVGYKVYDLSGRLISNEKVNQLKVFTLTTQKKGTYIVKFTLENGLTINKKVIF